MSKFGGGIGAPSKEERLKEAADIHLRLGQIQRYCELMVELGQVQSMCLIFSMVFNHCVASPYLFFYPVLLYQVTLKTKGSKVKFPNIRQKTVSAGVEEVITHVQPVHNLERLFGHSHCKESISIILRRNERIKTDDGQ